MNLSDKTPLYSQLSLTLMDYITHHTETHQKMFSEREICRRYNVSRTTVRTALKELEGLGYIYKRHGKGTFVSNLWKERQNLANHYSFTKQMQELGKIPKTQLLTFEILPADTLVAKHLDLELQEKVIRMKRLRIADNKKMMVETSYLPYALFPNLSGDMIKTKSLYDLFTQDFNQPIKYTDETFSASILNNHEAQLLDVTPGDACLRLKRSTFNRENRMIEFTLSIARSDQFVYTTRHYIHPEQNY